MIRLGLVLLLSGCAAVRSYDAELYTTLDRASRGDVEGAIRLLESNNRLPDKDLLYYLELGMLQRLGSHYEQSQKSWMSANARIQSGKGDLFAETMNLVRGVTSFAVGDKLRSYPGYDYEKVMLLTYMALNHLAMGDYDAARVAIKQTHEFEAEIGELRSRQFAEVEEAARKRGARTSVKELSGYPVQTIDNPEVNALRNSYQSALSHYLAGFIYEALGEPSLAAPGYRLANELQPGQALLEEALAGLDQRVSAPDDGMTDVLILIGTGEAPALQSRQFTIPVMAGTRMVLVSSAFPVMIGRTSSAAWPTRVVLDNRELPVAPITSVDLMARRRLKDDMPGIMLRATIRTAASAALQYQVQRAGAGDRDQAAAAALASLAIGLGSAMLSSADDRTWRALPSEVAIARGRLPRGAHTITLQAREGTRSARVDLAGRYAVVDLRLLRQQLFVSAPKAR